MNSGYGFRSSRFSYNIHRLQKHSSVLKLQFTKFSAKKKIANLADTNCHWQRFQIFV